MVSRRRDMARVRRPEVTFVTPLTDSSSLSSNSTSASQSNIAKAKEKEKLESNEKRHYPNIILWHKIESLIERMQTEDTGIPVRNFKSFMTTTPSVFTGCDLISWIMHELNMEDTQEALHLTSMISALGYIFPIEEHVLSVKNDHSLYRFQTPCLYPSRSLEADGVDYAVYLSKRTMQNKQRLELSDYEAERLARLQSLYCHKWEFIYMQAEAEAKVDKKRDKFERLVLESQERAYWDVHRPVPGCVNTTELDMRKLCRAKRPKKATARPCNYPVCSGPGGNLIFNGIENLSPQERLVKFNAFSERSRIKSSKAAENFQNYCDQYSAFDLLLWSNQSSNSGSNSDTNGSVILELSTNPWVTDNGDFWEQEKRLKEVPIRRVKRWSFSIHELLRDPAGKAEFQKWLEKEFSYENLRFWEACQEIKGLPLRELPKRIKEIYELFLAPNATEPLNVDARVAETVRKKVSGSSGSNPDRYVFEEAEEHIFRLMKSDSYHRFLRCEGYKDMLAGQKKKSKKKFATSTVLKQDNE